MRRYGTAGSDGAVSGDASDASDTMAVLACAHKKSITTVTLHYDWNLYSLLNQAMRLAGVATLRAGLVESSSVLEALLLLRHSVFQHVNNFKR